MLSRLLGGGRAAPSQTIGFDDLRRDLAAGKVALVDVREPGEFRAGHVPGSLNMPLSAFDPGGLPRDRSVVLICLSGGRSGRALGFARRAGCEAVHFQGGVSLWKSLGGPFSA